MPNFTREQLYVFTVERLLEIYEERPVTAHKNLRSCAAKKIKKFNGESLIRFLLSNGISESEIADIISK